MIEPTNRKSWLTFGRNLVPDTDSGSPFHFPHYCRTGDFRRFISISHTVTGRWNDIRQQGIMNPHYGSYLADIRIWINPEIWIQIPDHFWPSVVIWCLCHCMCVMDSPALHAACTVKLTKSFATWQHRFDVDSSFLSYPAPTSLL